MPTIDLSQLPQPAIIESLDYEVILAQTKTFMISVFPEAMRDDVAAAIELESEPLNIIAQAMAWRELLLRQRINDGVAACMLSHSTGSDLDNLGANMNVQRLVVTEATDTTPAVTESDAAFRMRIQSAFEGLSVAGPSGAYGICTQRKRKSGRCQSNQPGDRRKLWLRYFPPTGTAQRPKH